MSPLEPHNTTAVSIDWGNTTGSHDKDVKISFRHIIEVFKDEKNKSLKDIYENINKQWKEMPRTVQERNMEIESITKSITEDNQEIKNIGTQTATSNTNLTNKI